GSFLRRSLSPKGICSLCLLQLVLMVPLFAQAGDDLNRLRLAQAFEQAGEVERAVQLYQELLLRDQANFVYFDGLRRCFILAKRYDDAVNLSTLKLKSDPGDLGVRTMLGGILYRAEREAAADSVWSAVIAVNPHNQSLYRIVAASQIELRLFDEAILTYQHGRREIGDPLLFSEDLASLYSMMMDYPAAIREYLAMLRRSESQLDYIESRIALITARPEGLAAALHGVEIASLTDPSDIVLGRLLVWLYIEARQFESAYRIVSGIENRLRSGGTEIFTFAERAFREASYRVAATAYRRAVAENPEAQFVPQGRYGTALCVELLSDRGDTNAIGDIRINHHEAAAVYLALAAAYPGSTIAVQSLFRTAIIRYRRFFDLNGAMRLLDSAGAIVPTSTMKADISILAGEVMIAQGNLEGAAMRYQGVIGMSYAGETQRRQAFFQLAEIEYYHHQFDTAATRLADLAKMWTADESNDAILLNFFITENKDTFSEALGMYADAELRERQAKQGEAIALFALVREKFPDAPLADDALLKAGDLQSSLHRYQDALRSYKLLLHEYPVSSLREKVSYRIAALYEVGTGERDKALVAYEEFLAQYPQSLFSEDVRKRVRILRGDVKD
ncbi:MAG: tetratricopeptide repeat protein, partial [Ignavibacteriales bacterium]|nr:tetratricopeptide repeat protein [Ignavibacteriales bacterium]